MILKAAWVVPVTAPPMRDGFVEVREGRIASVGRASDRSFADREIVELGASVLLPGQVNPLAKLAGERIGLRGVWVAGRRVSFGD